MNMIPFTPFENALWNSFWNRPVRMNTLRQNDCFKLNVDVEDKGDHFEMLADLPGFRKEDVKIELTDDRLSIHAEREEEKEEKEKNYVFRERSRGSYVRSFDINGINQEAIEGSFSDGVLRLILPKAGEEKPAHRTLELKDSLEQKELPVAE